MADNTQRKAYAVHHKYSRWWKQRDLINYSETHTPERYFSLQEIDKMTGGKHLEFPKMFYKCY